MIGGIEDELAWIPYFVILAAHPNTHIGICLPLNVVTGPC